MIARPAFRAAVAAAVLLVIGCATPVPRTHPEIDAAEAAGVQPGEAITFREELPDDSPDVKHVASQGLSLSRVVRLTAQNSADIQAAMARVRIAQADAKQFRLLPNPVMSLALRFPQGGASIIDAGLSADLIALLKRPGTINVADSRLRAASAEAVIVVLDEVAASQEHYYTIQSLEAAIVVLNERRELIDRLLSLAESKLRIGEGTRLDVVTLQTQHVELQAEIADVELQLRDERLALARRMGQPSSTAEWTLPMWSSLAETNVDEAVTIRAALEHRPEVQQRFWELAAFGYERKLASWDAWNGSDVGIAAERDGEWSVGPSASLPIPLFDMGQAQRERAMASVIEARHQLTSARRQVIEEVRRAFSTLAGSRKSLDRVKNELLPLQEARLTQAEAQFRAGQTDITSLLIAEQDLRSSRARLIELQRKVAIAQVRLERAVGGAGMLATHSLRSTTSPSILPTTQRTK